LQYDVPDAVVSRDAYRNPYERPYAQADDARAVSRNLSDTFEQAMGEAKDFDGDHEAAHTLQQQFDAESVRRHDQEMAQRRQAGETRRQFPGRRPPTTGLARGQNATSAANRVRRSERTNEKRQRYSGQGYTSESGWEHATEGEATVRRAEYQMHIERRHQINMQMNPGIEFAGESSAGYVDWGFP
jgi:hypothetical protein